MGLLGTLRRALGTHSLDRPTIAPLSGADEARLAALETHVRALRSDVNVQEHSIQELRQDEARRAAEHATMVDQLSRLYKRVSARIQREHEPPVTPPSDTGESVLEMRTRLRR